MAAARSWRCRARSRIVRPALWVRVARRARHVRAACPPLAHLRGANRNRAKDPQRPTVARVSCPASARMARVSCARRIVALQPRPATACRRGQAEQAPIRTQARPSPAVPVAWAATERATDPRRTAIPARALRALSGRATTAPPPSHAARTTPARPTTPPCSRAVAHPRFQPRPETSATLGQYAQNPRQRGDDSLARREDL